MLYVNEGLHYKRRDDLELQNIENIWIELANSLKRILLGLFYRPPNPDAAYLAHVEDSISLAIDTGILELIITGDFNLNLFNQQGPLVQSVISLMSSLRVITLTVLADSMYNILKFFAEKM